MKRIVRFLNKRVINARSYFVLRDLDVKENKQVKKDLEEQVLDKLNIKWEKKINGGIVSLVNGLPQTVHGSICSMAHNFFNRGF